MSLLNPTKEQLEQILSMPDDGPLAFINMLKFSPNGGAESFRQYAEKFMELMAPKGVKSLFQGDAVMTLVGEEQWDEVAIVHYPCISTWRDMVQSEEYQQIAHLRADAVLDARLVIVRQSGEESAQ
jgi:uncharacterized protein (DUF1330 family)